MGMLQWIEGVDRRRVFFVGLELVLGIFVPHILRM